MVHGASKVRPPWRVALAVGALLAGAVWSDGPSTGAAERGRLLYAIHCASCHGATGRGDGPMVRFLNVTPADLTRLAERNAGVFPTDRVRRTIDGRDEVRGHGTRDMPVWGATFRNLGDMGQASEELDQEVASRIELLAEHLATLQGGSTPPAEQAPKEPEVAPPPTRR